MLWQNDNRPYVRELYGLDDSGMRLRSTYWGIPDHAAAGVGASVPLPRAVPEEADPRAQTSAERPQVDRNDIAPAQRPGRGTIYARSLLTIIPWFIWLLALVGVPGRRRAPVDELLVTIPLLITSVAIARIVGADPRTQLFIVPLVVFYAARGVQRIGDWAETRSPGTEIRRGFATGIVTAIVAVALMSTVAHWVYMGLSMGSPHHTVGAANHAMGDALKARVPEDEPVMSWHPATALFADREWRVLPYAPLEDIIGYANAIDTEFVVLSAFYPGSQFVKGLERDHLLLHVPPGAQSAPDAWRTEIVDVDATHAFARLTYTAAAGADGEQR
jgi:hypothetical protein